MAVLDYVVLAAYVAGIVLIGLLVSRRRAATTEDYFLGGRSIPWMAGTASLIATAISCKSLIGLPGLAFTGDLTYLQMYLVVPLAAWLVSVIFLPFFSKLRITSAYEYLGRRFNPRVQSFGSLLFQIETALVLGTVIAAPCLVMSEATGLSYNVCVLILLAATLIYTSVGGVKAVVWTDVVQLFIFASVPLLLVGFVLWSSASGGGVGALIETARAHNKLRLFDFSFDLTTEVTIWASLISMLFWHASSYGVNQVLIQRYMTARSQRESRRSIIVGSIGSVMLWAAFLVTGVFLFAANQLRPGMVPENVSADRVFTAFMMATLPAGLKGAFIAAAFAAGMSTLSSMLNSMGTVTLVDVWRLHCSDGANEQAWIARARLLTLVWGLFSFGAALFVLRFGTVITAGIKLGSVISGALFGMFLLGVFVRRAVAAGVVIGAVVSQAMLVAVIAWTDISWSWYCGIGTLVTVAVGYASSLFYPATAGGGSLSCEQLRAQMHASK